MATAFMVMDSDLQHLIENTWAAARSPRFSTLAEPGKFLSEGLMHLTMHGQTFDQFDEFVAAHPGVQEPEPDPVTG